ncbi:hypothetical protein JM18_009778, partial [Phytophthora kernoviae]
MEVRFKTLSISADVAVKDEDGTNMELPTLTNEVIKMTRGVIAKKRTVKKEILKRISGVFKPGTITLVLGQPGSGKSSLMKLLSGRFPEGENVKIEGEVTYNGTSRANLRTLLPQFASYVAQRDHHNPLLTAKETLEFAHACGGGESFKHVHSHDVLDESADVFELKHKQYPDTVIQQLGLETCQNTIVGDAMVRGVSGGERKRVMTGEMAFGDKYVMVMDEITTGLDSAAAYDIINTQRSIAKKFHKTVVISLLQPSPEIFALFDDVVILNDDYVMYSGPREKTLDYFESLGFKCPPHRDVADFLLDLGTGMQYQYEAHGNFIPRTPCEFAKAYEGCAIYTRVLQDVEESVNPSVLQSMTALLNSQPEFNQGFWPSTSLLMKRQITTLKREASGLIGRLIMNTILGLLYSAIFYQINPADSQLFMGALFEVVLCLSLALSSQIPVIMAAREVFYKQCGANFFRTVSYVLSYSASQVIPIIFESLVFGSVVYWMCGFVNTAGGFIIFMVIICLTNIAFLAFFFLLASVSPNLNMANPISSVSVFFFTLYAGFTTTKGQIPDYLVWLYWINPLGWSIRALAVNQYSDSRFDTCVYGGVDYCTNYGMTMGKYTLSIYEVPSETFWIWWGIVYIVATYVFFTFLSCIVLEYYRYESPENVMLDMKSKNETTEEYTLTHTPCSLAAEHEPEHLMHVVKERHVVPVTVAFKDLWYTVPDPNNPKNTI